MEKRKPASRKETARDVARNALADVVRGGAYASIALNRQLSQANLSAEDRRLATSIFYIAAENRLKIGYFLDRFTEQKPDPVVTDILHIAAAQLLFLDRVPDHAVVDEAVKQVKNSGRPGLAALANGVLRNLIRARDAGELTLPDREAEPEKYLSVQYSISENLVRRLLAAYGEQAEQIMAHRPAPMQTIRPNRMKTSPEAFEKYLTSRDVRWEHATVRDAYNCSASGDLTRLDGYVHGYYSLMGESSMLAAYAVGAKPGMNILDACAAPGGKSALIAESMMGTGRVYAWDVHEHRVELIRAARRRLQLDNLRPAVRDARKPYPDFEMLMDAVLVDAPCSGLGVIADKPDIKYRVTDENIESLLPLQREILENCARFVRPGGLLVYSTCTILPEENGRQIEAFLENHPEFEPEDDNSFLPEGLRDRTHNGCTQLLAHRDNLEGFFIARMRRRAV